MPLLATLGAATPGACAGSVSGFARPRRVERGVTRTRMGLRFRSGRTMCLPMSRSHLCSKNKRLSKGKKGKGKKMYAASVSVLSLMPPRLRLFRI